MHRRARMMTVVIAAILSVMALPAYATMLTSAGGQVRVDIGKGFRPVPTVTKVAPGKRIAVGENATAMLHYPNGCTVTIAAGISITVASKPSCPNPANRPIRRFEHAFHRSDVCIHRRRGDCGRSDCGHRSPAEPP
jgi:hypothetical protein